jgi:excisionase family DNA binding protein
MLSAFENRRAAAARFCYLPSRETRRPLRTNPCSQAPGAFRPTFGAPKKGRKGFSMPRRTKTAPASLKGHPPILTVLEAAQLLRVSRSALYQQIREGRVPAMRVGHRMRISRESSSACCPNVLHRVRIVNALGGKQADTFAKSCSRRRRRTVSPKTRRPPRSNRGPNGTLVSGGEAVT